MKLLTHCFSRAIVSAFLDSQTEKSSNNFELMAALMAQRWCEAIWEMPMMICYYMKEKYHHELLKDDAGKNPKLWIDALENGIDAPRRAACFSSLNKVLPANEKCNT